MILSKMNIDTNPWKEVNEMDVNVINTAPYSIPRSSDFTDLQAGGIAAGRKPEVSLPFATGNSAGEEVREQVIMSLQDVQNFLYMMIGSKIRIQSESNTLGSSVNTAA